MKQVLLIVFIQFLTVSATAQTPVNEAQARQMTEQVNKAAQAMKTLHLPTDKDVTNTEKQDGGQGPDVLQSALATALGIYESLSVCIHCERQQGTDEEQ